MAETVQCGVYRAKADLAGKSVAAIRVIYATLWSISPKAIASLNGLDLPPGHEYIVIAQPGDDIEFRTKNTQSRTICSECDKPTHTEIEGYPLCYDHYQHTVTHCTEHVWLLDSTEVFQEHGKPVIRAFYFCTICARAVVAKASETAEQAWFNRQRERLLRIEQLLTEET